MSQRKQRVEHGLRDVLTELIAREVKDPRVRAATLITVTKVELNVDLSVAHVYVSIIGDDATADGVLAGLAKAAGFLRGPAGRKLNLQHAPELRFIADASVDMSEKLAAIIRDDEARARAAGRDPKAAAAVPAAPATLDPPPRATPIGVPDASSIEHAVPPAPAVQSGAEPPPPPVEMPPAALYPLAGPAPGGPDRPDRPDRPDKEPA
jgi:ribosome-binding factor A